MSSNNKNPFEEDFLNSTVYHVAGKVAEGINKAANEVAKAVDSIPNSNNRGPQSNGANYNRVDPPPPVYGPGYQGEFRGAKGAQQGADQRRSSQKTGRTVYNNTYSYNYPPKPRPVPPPKMPKEKKGGARFIVPAIFLIIFAAGLPTSGLSSLILLAGVGVAGYFIGRAITKSSRSHKEKKAIKDLENEKIRIQKEQEAAAEAAKKAAQQEKAKKSTGNPELDKIIDEGDQYIVKLRAANDAIKDEGVSQSIDRMEKASRGIFDYVAENPSKIFEIKKFMNYYLPTTLKLLNSYEKLDRQAVKGENISATMFDIEGMMQTIATAFEKQLDGLFGSEAMDIQADIEVFETILTQEGLKDTTQPKTK